MPIPVSATVKTACSASSSVLTTIRDTAKLDDDTKAQLESEVDEFARNWQGKESASITDPGTEANNPMVEDVNQEQIVKGRR